MSKCQVVMLKQITSHRNQDLSFHLMMKSPIFRFRTTYQISNLLKKAKLKPKLLQEQSKKLTFLYIKSSASGQLLLKMSKLLKKKFFKGKMVENGFPLKNLTNRNHQSIHGTIQLSIYLPPKKLSERSSLKKKWKRSSMLISQ
jgi:hypothetical protein